eukprot:239951-Pelagomonas_calceolata.AAC.4
MLLCAAHGASIAAVYESRGKCDDASVLQLFDSQIPPIVAELQGAISGRPSQSDNGGSKGVNIKRPGSPVRWMP